MSRQNQRPEPDRHQNEGLLDEGLHDDGLHTEGLHDEFVVRLLEHRHRIIAFIAKQLVHAADVEDVFQKTCLVLWKKMENYDPQANFFSWACGIAFNEIRNHATKKRRDRLHFDPALLELLAAEAAAEESLSESRMSALRVCMKKLSSAQQELMNQCYSGSTTITDVAEDLGLNRGALYKQLARVRSKLLVCIRHRLGAAGADA